MKRWSNPLRLASALLAIPLLAACAPGVVPTADPQVIEEQVATSVAMTIEAQGQIATSVELTVGARETEAAAAAPTETPSPVPPPATPTPAPATATPLPTNTSASGGSGGSGSGGGGGSSTLRFSCDIIRQRPIDNTEFKRRNEFDVSFAILNNGTATWDAGKDLVLLGNPGQTLINPPGIIELPEMKPGDIFAVGPFDARAPEDPGHYVIDFKLEGGFCYPYVAFNVVR
jgi:hypothetical protein